MIDYYHACEYIHKLSEALFRDARRAQAWARKMCRWLKEKPRAIYRILHSAAAIRSRRIVRRARSKAYRKAYGYLRKHIRHLDYVGYRRNHLPIGSGVTEAACKTVFTQRLKQSGMAWKVEGGQWIVDLRVIHLSGVWSRGVSILLAIEECFPKGGLRRDYSEEEASKCRIIPGTGAIAPSKSRGCVRVCRSNSASNCWTACSASSQRRPRVRATSRFSGSHAWYCRAARSASYRARSSRCSQCRITCRRRCSTAAAAPRLASRAAGWTTSRTCSATQPSTSAAVTDWHSGRA